LYHPSNSKATHSDYELLRISIEILALRLVCVCCTGNLFCYLLNCLSNLRFVFSDLVKHTVRLICCDDETITENVV